MKKIIKLIKSDSTFLFVIIHVITTLALILFISLKYDWIVEQFGSYTFFVVTCAPIGGFIVGTYYLLSTISRCTSTRAKKVRITIMNDSEYNYDEDYKNLHDLIFYISVVIFIDWLNKEDNSND